MGSAMARRPNVILDVTIMGKFPPFPSSIQRHWRLSWTAHACYSMYPANASQAESRFPCFAGSKRTFQA